MHLWRNESQRTQGQDQKYNPGDERARRKPVLMLLSISEWAEELSRQARSSHYRGVWFPTRVSPAVRTGLRFLTKLQAITTHRQTTMINFFADRSTSALKLSTASHNKSMRNAACFNSNRFWFIISNNTVHLQKMQSRLPTVEALGGKKRWSSYNISKLIPYISAFYFLSKVENSDLAEITIKQFSDSLLQYLFHMCMANLSPDLMYLLWIYRAQRLPNLADNHNFVSITCQTFNMLQVPPP